MPFTGYSIQVGETPLDYTGQSIPSTDIGKVTTVDRELEDITYQLESIYDDGIFQSANIYYERPTMITEAQNQRGAPVTISLDGSVVFFGFVRGQSIQKRSVVLRCVSVTALVNDAPIHGSKRVSIGLGQFSYNTLTVFNEGGLADREGINGSPPPYDGYDQVINDSSYDQGTKWTKHQAIMYALGTLEEISAGSFTKYFDFRALVQEINTHLRDDVADDDLTITGSIIDEVAVLARHQGKTLKVQYLGVHPSIKVRVKITDRYGEQNRKTITLDKDATIGDTDRDGIPFDFELSLDYNSPTACTLGSGKTWINTMVYVRPANIENYGSVETDDDDGGQFLRFEVSDLDLNFFEHQTRLRDLLKPGKARQFTDLKPRITGVDDEGNPIFAEKFEIWIYPHSSIAPGVSFTSTDMLVGGEAWRDLELKSRFKYMQAIQKLKYQLSRDRFRLDIKGFRPKITISAQGIGTKDYDDSIADFKEKVLRIKIPVAIEVEERLLAYAERGRSSGNTHVIAVSRENPIPPKYDPRLHRYLFRVEEKFMPYREKDAFTGWSPGAGILTGDSDGNHDSLIAKMKLAAKRHLQRGVLEDGTRVSISIPVEFWSDLADTYPKEIGNFISGFATADQASDSDRKYGQVQFPRNVGLVRILYDRRTVRLDFE